MLEECEEGHVYVGKIIDFDTVAYVPKERLTKGMTVDSKEGPHRVNFTRFTKNTPVVDTSSLNVGNQVLVLGKQYGNRQNSTIPEIIMITERQQLLFARERDMFSWKGDLADYVQALSYLLALILCGISQFSFFLNFPLGLLQSTTISLQIGSIALIFFIIMIGVDWYRSYVVRSRVVQCDTETWNIVRDEISKRFSISIT